MRTETLIVVTSVVNWTSSGLVCCVVSWAGLSAVWLSAVVWESEDAVFCLVDSSATDSGCSFFCSEDMAKKGMGVVMRDKWEV